MTSDAPRLDTIASNARGNTGLAGLALALPTVLAGLLAAGMAWREGGSILPADWLPYAILLALLAAVVLAAGIAVEPSPSAVLALAGVSGLALWSALSAAWSPLPSAARDEALLVATYALAVAVPLVTLRGRDGRTAAAAGLVAISAALAVATAAELVWGASADDRFDVGRLTSPIGYVNAQGAAFLLAVWPAVSLAARRDLGPLVRAFAGGAATAMLAAWLVTQSKGGGIALGAAAVVVLAVSPGRLRLAVPAAIAGVLVAASYGTLTDPFPVRDQTGPLIDAAQAAGTRILVLTVAGAAVTAAYALVDERLSIPGNTRRLLGRIAAGVLIACVVIGAAAFLAREHHPIGWLGDRWDTFKSLPAHESGSSHLVNLGSNRYDFWRVALSEFKAHPLVGVGSRGWDVAYLRHGRSDETPRRSHSLELDTAAELGLVGLALLALAFVPLFVGLFRRARQDLLGAGLLGAATYFAVHSAGDWIWTFPAVGIVLFLFAGIGLSGDDPPALPGPAAWTGAGVAAAVVLLAFAPVWVAASITSHVAEHPGTDPHADLTWARRLDPLSPDPFVTEAQLAKTPAGAIPPLRDAVSKEPDAAALRYLLGDALLGAGQKTAAQRELQEAHRLAPRDPLIAAALRRAG
ncbi:MAG TPA: O-antigen ligase family protein [Gaiellaceae bacterium]|nr:O-antigen ligase family protein [Gaiellaceae bacterium]